MKHRRKRRRPETAIAVLVSCMLAGMAGTAMADENTSALYQCRGGSVTVEANDIVFAKRVCRKLDEANSLFRQCGIKPTGHFHVSVVSSIAGIEGNPLAVFDGTSGTIEVIHPDSIADSMVPGSPYLGLSPDDVFDSLIVHELSHAMLQPTLQNGQRRLLILEYIASAFQISLMDSKARHHLVQRYPPIAPVGLAEINAFTLHADPVLFGVKAWRHFSAPENGCRFVQDLLRGDEAFPSSNHQ